MEAPEWDPLKNDTLPPTLTPAVPPLPPVFHPDPDESLLHTGDFQSEVKIFPRATEIQGSSVCQVTSIGVTVILLYTSRACYNLFILSFSQTKKVNSFDYDWYNVSDQANLKCQLGDAGYIVFGVILFIWELLPTSLVVYFFRVRNPTKDLANAGIVPSHGFSPRSYFFDNPRRYDSDDDLAWNIAPQGAQGRLLRLEPSEQQFHGLHRIPPTRSSTGHRPAKPCITSINYSIPRHSDIKTDILKNKA
ncbi:integral membrane protein GPR137B isoform X4 [Manacus candei]|uniref:integral membrane protein GPR137B isoform X4 n=1 Tax=Manacus candei TaxID=415023 RepID=UPI0022279DE8|nr:integral membrane protein GPR137B isoform X4 [Manacus candei]